LREHKLRPADLLSTDWPHDVSDVNIPLEIRRLLTLLDRGAALAFAVEAWTNRGLWVLSRSDEAYPRRLKARLGRLAPPLLYGVGDASLLSAGGLAVVGSRDAADSTMAATRQVAQACAEQEIAIVSGGARGVDSEAMLSALAAGGRVVGILADSLSKTAVAGKYRHALLNDSLVLASPYHPDSGFNAGNAMGRNKYIYALADWGLVMSAAVGEGGTWVGANEALKRRWLPLFVWSAESVVPGNAALLKQGAVPFPLAPWLELSISLTYAAAEAEALRVQQKAPLFSKPITTDESLRVKSSSEQEAFPGEIGPPQQLSNDVFRTVLPVLLAHLEQPCDAATLAQQLEVRPVQLQDWLTRAVKEGRVKKLNKPARYVAVQHAQGTLAIAGV